MCEQDEKVEDLPVRPTYPLPSDCCGSGCNPCVYDIYEQDLKQWEINCANIKAGNDVEANNDSLILPSEYKRFEITEISSSSKNSLRIKFKLPENRCLGLKTGQHIIIRENFNDAVITRPYTPISDVNLVGSFELLIKLYNNGQMSSAISKWKVGNQIEMRGPFGNFYYQSNRYKRILMLAAGTGIAPMYQIITRVLNNEYDYTYINLLYASKTLDDILLREELYSLQSYWNFSVSHFLSEESDLNSKKYNEEVYLSRVSKEHITKEISKFAIDNIFFLICGTKSFEKDMINYIQNIPNVNNENIHRF